MEKRTQCWVDGMRFINYRSACRGAGSDVMPVPFLGSPSLGYALAVSALQNGCQRTTAVESAEVPLWLYPHHLTRKLQVKLHREAAGSWRDASGLRRSKDYFSFLARRSSNFAAKFNHDNTLATRRPRRINILLQAILSLIIT